MASANTTRGEPQRSGLLGDVQTDGPAAPVIVVLGRCALVTGGRLVALAPASQRLLAYVALSGRVVSRDRAAGVLWSTVPEHRAHTSLRSALARLRTSAPDVLRADAAELSLAAGVRVDLHEAQLCARQLLANPHGSVATSLAETAMAAILWFSTELLPGWYEDWVLVEAEGWRQLRLHALEALSTLLARLSRYGEAVAAAQAAVGADPLRESAQTALIRAHLREGNQSEALREFEQYRRQLYDQLGLKPTQRLRSLLPC